MTEKKKASKLSDDKKKIKSRYTKLKEELNGLIEQANLIVLSIAIDVGVLTDKEIKKCKDQKLENINVAYQKWYSLSLQVIRQILPDRLDDFILQYKNEKRKVIDNLTYSISDYLAGITLSRNDTIIVDRSAAFPKIQMQLAILESVQTRFKTKIFDISEVLQADIFDSEIEAAKELNKKGFVRASGAIGGVVLEKHLGKVCIHHERKPKKQNPSINDFNELLKKNEIIDTAQWRFIQHLGDIRNLCDHHKEKEPTKDDVIDFIAGVEKIIKTVY